MYTLLALMQLDKKVMMQLQVGVEVEQEQLLTLLEELEVAGLLAVVEALLQQLLTLLEELEVAGLKQMVELELVCPVVQLVEVGELVC
jgi:hypothetical protein